MGGETMRALAKKFGKIRKLWPKLGKAMLHVPLLAASEERVTDKQWQQIAQLYDVLIRLDGDHGLVLLKGLSKANLEMLKNVGSALR